MAKTKYVKVEGGYTDFVAYRTESGYGWDVVFDGYHFYLSDETIDSFIEFLNKIKKEAGK